jgi:hypothetical protein
MSDVLERHLDDAFAALNAVSVRELEATAELLERRRDGLGKYASIFRNVAWARQNGSDLQLARFHLRQNVTSPRDDVSLQIADATAPFWQHVRSALEEGLADGDCEKMLAGPNVPRCPPLSP